MLILQCWINPKFQNIFYSVPIRQFHKFIFANSRGTLIAIYIVMKCMPFEIWHPNPGQWSPGGVSEADPLCSQFQWPEGLQSTSANHLNNFTTVSLFSSPQKSPTIPPILIFIVNAFIGAVNKQVFNFQKKTMLNFLTTHLYDFWLYIVIEASSISRIINETSTPNCCWIFRWICHIFQYQQ